MDQENELLEEFAEATPPSMATSDQRVIVGQTGQNILGLVIGATATFIAQIFMSHRLGKDAYGVVTVATQFAFIAAAATRFGMDVANVRLISILVGREEGGRARGLARRAAAIATAVSVPFAILALLAAPWLAEAFSGLPEVATPAFRWAAVTVPFAALAFTYMGATRGLKIMRYTLFAQWIAQPIGWILVTVAIWAVAAATAGWASAAFAISWVMALVIAYWGWAREQRKLPREIVGDGIPEESPRALWKFGALRAPGTLFSQLLFWTDLFVLSYLMAPLGAAGASQVGVYSAVLRAAQSLFLFLTSVSLTLSPFVADLHHRGEREHLNKLYRQVTRWTLAATVPVLLVLIVMPGQVLRIFGPEYVSGASALRIVALGMIAPVMVGTVGFILIMAGRTGWDLLVYLAALVIDISIALALAQPDVLGVRGAAIAQACTLTFSAIARLFLVRRFLQIWPFDLNYLRLIVPTVAGGAVMLAVHMVVPEARWFINLLVASAAGAAAYLGLVLAVGLAPGEKTVVRKKVATLRARQAAG